MLVLYYQSIMDRLFCIGVPDIFIKIQSIFHFMHVISKLYLEESYEPTTYIQLEQAIFGHVIFS